MLLRSKFVALMCLTVVALLSGCGKTDAQMEKDIQGWWMATEMVPEGSGRFKPSTADETLIVGFNDTFQFYVIDGSHRDCGGEKHGYRVKSGRVEVDSTSKCEAKSAVIHEVTKNTLTLRDARLANSTVFTELVLVKISQSDVEKLYERYQLNVTLAELAETVKSRPSSAPIAAPPKVKTSAPTKEKTEGVPAEPLSPKPAQKIERTDAEQEQHDASKLTSAELEGIWIIRSVRYQGNRYVPGEKFTNHRGQSVHFQVPRYAVQMKDGKLTVYGDAGTFARELNYDYVKNEVILKAQGQQAPLFPIRALNLKKGEMRIGDSNITNNLVKFDKLGDGAIFERISVEEGRKIFYDNDTFLVLNPQE